MMTDKVTDDFKHVYEDFYNRHRQAIGESSVILLTLPRHVY